MAADSYQVITSPIVELWSGLLRRAAEVKRPFNERCAQIEQFYAGDAGFMFTNNYMNRFMGGPGAFTPPKFKITINKAFEYIAVMGPMLFWQMADRKVAPYKSMDLDPFELLGIQMPQEGEQIDPMQQQMVEQAQMLAQQQAQENVHNEIRAKLFQRALNYFQREQFGGGLGAHINVAINEALLKGVAFLSTEDYQYPSSDRTLVGSFYVCADDVLADPDCKDPLWTKAKWVSIRHRSNVYELEQYFGLPKGSLLAYCATTSPSANFQAGSSLGPGRTQAAERDQVEWYEIFSRAGTGNRLSGARATINGAFDEVIDNEECGGCAYLVIVNGCPYPLNMPSYRFANRELPDGTAIEGMTEDDIKIALKWPTEYWRDNKWPVSKLAFYPFSKNPLWPEPPMSAAIGELTCLNILASAYIQTAYDNKQQIIAAAKEIAADVKKKLASADSPIVLETDSAGRVGQSIDQMLKFMERPQINGDVPKTIDFLLHMFEQRTGMLPVLYGESGGANARSAAEYNGRRDTVNIRPDYMAKCVADWQSEVADKEMFCAWSHVQSSDIREHLGPFGVVAWDKLITNENPEVILRGAEVFVEASAMARPNKERDAAALDRMQQTFLPIFAGELAQHGDNRPINGFIKAVGEATNIDVSAILIPDREPDEESVQMQKAMQQAELESIQADSAKKNAEAQKAMADGQSSMQDSQMEMVRAQQDMQMKATEAGLKQQQAEHGMAIKQADAETKIETQRQLAAGKLAATAQQANLKQRQFEFDNMAKMEQARLAIQSREQEARQKLATDLIKRHMDMTHQQQVHQQSMALKDDQATQQAQHMNLITYSKMLREGLRKTGSGS